MVFEIYNNGMLTVAYNIIILKYVWYSIVIAGVTITIAYYFNRNLSQYIFAGLIGLGIVFKYYPVYVFIIAILILIYSMTGKRYEE
jgi:hypothetical protein